METQVMGRTCLPCTSATGSGHAHSCSDSDSEESERLQDSLIGSVGFVILEPRIERPSLT